MKILIGQIAHETNTFSTVKTTVEDFKSWQWYEDEEVVSNHRNVRDFLGGMIDKAEELEIEMVPGFSTFAMPSGIITSETNQRLKNELLDRVLNKEFDAICLSLHGAGVAEDTFDLEGDILEAVRAAVGEKVPIVVTLDLHGNLTEKMVKYADVLLGVNYYPHVDCYERGREAVGLAKEMLEGKLIPTMYLKTLPLLIPTSTTNQRPAKTVNEVCWEQEKKEGVFDCTFFHGFPYTDIPELGVSVLTITNNQPQLAKEIAAVVSQKIWELREDFFPKIASPREGIKVALEIEGGPVVINETSDNPGGGTPGDGTHLLSALLEEGVRDTCFGFICDPEVVNLAHHEGVGKTIDVLLGGKTDAMHGQPLAVQAYIKTLADGTFIQSSPMGRGSKVSYGKSVRLVVNGIDIIVCSKKSQVLDEQIFLLHGIDVRSYKIVALKSSQHFRAGFEPIAKEIITVDSPGLSSFQLDSFTHTRLEKPMYPFSKETVFTEAPLKN
ncbi:M81 family peptidase [Anaerobacillus alkaliphilus]|uniref:M81 family peptidase n=1 Tax=Anaerobacillus alkaliphilus TaxID=1548597 RepID=A0A4Q0VMZ5_9BACI|nr:M81 family metallopeptidase [Anaerobacillus alkaliphilus]RXI96172.1 M81 family peptidase [Anaerobacillus alkaliphilus]